MTAVPNWLRTPESAARYAQEAFPEVVADLRFEEDLEEFSEAYSNFARSLGDTVTLYRAFSIPAESINLNSIGLAWSAQYDTADCHGVVERRGKCRIVFEAVFDANDIDWPRSFESFLLWNGPSQWEVNPKANAEGVLIAVWSGSDRRDMRTREVIKPESVFVGESREDAWSA